MKKLIVLLMSVVMLFGVVACGGGGSKEPPVSDNFIEDTTTPQVVKDKITIRVFTGVSANQPENLNDVSFWKEMERRTNIHVEWVTAPNAAYEEKRALQWEDKKNQVDVFLGKNSGDIATLAADGALAPIGEYIDKYAVNYKNLIKDYDYVDKYTTMSDGNIYSFAQIRTLESCLRNLINKIWLEEQGKTAEDIKTMDDLYEFLKAGVAKDPEHRIGTTDREMTLLRNYFMCSYGYVAANQEVAVENKDGSYNAVYVPMTDNYREYLKFCNKLWKDNLLDHQVFTLKTPKDVAARSNNTPNIGFFVDSAAFLVVGQENERQYDFLGPLTSEINTTKIAKNTSPRGVTADHFVIIPQSSKYVREIVKWVDCMYSDEMRIWSSWGEEGVSFEWKKNEKGEEYWSWKPTPEGMTPTQFRAMHATNPGTGLFAAQMAPEVYYKLEPGSDQKIREDAMLRVSFPYLVSQYPKGFTYMAEESKAMATKQADLDTFYKTNEAEFIMGTKDPNNDGTWSQYLADIKKVGAEEYQNLAQQAFDRFTNAAK